MLGGVSIRAPLSAQTRKRVGRFKCALLALAMFSGALLPVGPGRASVIARKGTSVVVNVGTFTIGGSLGQQTRAHGLGEVPKALIFFTRGRSPANGFDVHTEVGVSFITKSGASFEEFCVAISQDNGSASGFAHRRMGARALYLDGSGALLIEGSMVSWDATNFTIDITSVAPGDRRIHFMAIGGAGLTNAKAIKWDADSSEPQDVTTVGFSPGLVLNAFAYDLSTSLPANAQSAHLGFGAMDAAGNQWTTMFLSVNGVNPTDANRAQNTAACIGNIHWAGLSTGQKVFSTMLSNGFRVTNSNWLAGTSAPVISLALKGPRFKVGNFNKTTGAPPASQSVSDVGFPPKGFLLSGVGGGGLAVHAKWGLGAASGVGEEKSVAIWDQDNLSPSRVRGYQEDKVFALVSNTGSDLVEYEADLSAFTSNGVDLNWTTNDPSGGPMHYVAIGDPA